MEVGGTAFTNRPDLTSIRLPDSIVTIGSRSFENCKGLT
ncbi:leucine-rich repeat protein, partial [Escherichia coli]|nr:leucine-rich repeat protein [Escherichia coli K-12]